MTRPYSIELVCGSMAWDGVWVGGMGLHVSCELKVVDSMDNLADD